MGAVNFQPFAVQGHEGTPQASPVYAYAIRADDLSDGVFLTSWDESLAISGLPARFGASNPQTFAPTQISHAPITRRADFDRNGFEVVARFDTANLPAYFLTTPTVPLTVEIIRIAKGTVGTAGADIAAWGIDTYVVQSGLIQTVTLEGDVVTVSCTPSAFHMEGSVPRLWFNRTCQWALYGAGCGLDSTAFDWESQITALNQRNRQITVSGNNGQVPKWFEAGFLEHNPTGGRFTIFGASINGSSDTVLTLGHWNGALEVGDQVVLYPGCNRTVNHCTNKFNNAANFGGFAKIPDRNPTIHGV
jgi:hypothetical protein